MLSGEGNENSNKTAMGLISKMSFFSRAAHLFVHLFAIVLHDYNMKLPEIALVGTIRKKNTKCHFNWPGKTRRSSVRVYLLCFVIF